MLPTDSEDSTTPRSTEVVDTTLGDLVTPGATSTNSAAPENASGGNLPPAAEEARTVETPRDALQREAMAIIQGASDYEERHDRDRNGSMGLKQIELTVRNNGENGPWEKISVGYFRDNPQATQLLIDARSLSPLEYPPFLYGNAMGAGFSPIGQRVIDYTLRQDEQDIKRGDVSFARYPWDPARTEKFGESSGIAQEGDIQELRKKIASATIEGKKGKPNLQVSTLLQRGTPTASALPTTL